MPKKKLPQTIEECNAELERTQKLLQQYENRNKISVLLWSRNSGCPAKPRSADTRSD